MKTYISIIFFLTYTYKTYSQDTIVFVDNQKRVIAKILEVLPEEIKYKKFTNQDGPTFTVKKTEVEKVIYSDGELEKFNLLKVDTKTFSSQNTSTIKSEKKAIFIDVPPADSKYSQPKIKYSFKVGSEAVFSDAQLSPDGLIYIGGSKNELLVLDKNGNIVKKISIDDSMDSEVGFLSDGTAVIGDNGGNIYFIDKKFNKKKVFNSKAPIHGNILITKDIKSGDDLIAYGDDAGVFHVLDKDGLPLNNFSTIGKRGNQEERAVNSISALNNGGFAVTSDDDYLYFLNQDCTEKYKPFKAGRAFDNPPLIDIDGSIKVTSYDSHAYFFNPDGTLQAKYKTGDLASSLVSRYPNNAKYPKGFYVFSSADGNIYFLDNKAEKIVSPISISGSNIITQTISSPVILPNGLIAIGAEDSFIHYFNMYGKEVAKIKVNSVIRIIPLVLDDGTLVFGTGKGLIQYIESPKLIK